ncbi:hypothetical protein O9929_14700 [Vibrio lentus]|nr:hypothetical protein [Vibrio lentus]
MSGAQAGIDSQILSAPNTSNGLVNCSILRLLTWAWYPALRLGIHLTTGLPQHFFELLCLD